MSRRQSLDRPGILSPPGPFLTPSPSPSISASPRLQPSPSLSPFPQDALLVTGNHLTNNSTHEQERKTVTPGRRQSIHQFTNGSPSAGTVVFQPSPSQSPAAATSVIGVTAGGGLNVVAGFPNSVSQNTITTTLPTITTTGNELNTTLVGSNNIQLNKKGTKRQQQQQYQQQQQQQHHQIFSSSSHYSHLPSLSTTTTIAGGYGQLHATTVNNTPNTFATTTVASTTKNQTKKGTGNSAAVLPISQQSQQPQQQQFHYQTSSPLIADSPSPSPSGTAITSASIKPPTPQPTMQMFQQQFTISSNGNGSGPPQQQTFQLIQGPQGQIIAAATSHQQNHHMQQQQQHQQHRFNPNPTTNIMTSTPAGVGSKSTKAPQQILPKPQQLHQQHQQQQQLQQQQQHLQQHQQQQLVDQITLSQQQKTKPPNPTPPLAPVTSPSNMSQPSLAQISQSAQPGQQQQIILPSGATASLTTTAQQPLLLNQVPVLVQQNTPQGVQLILRPPTPQLTATPSLVIQNRAQPQLQQHHQHPQQVLRILGTNGATMQLAAATPTFIVSSQANLIQQANHLQTIKAQSQSPAITQLSGLHAALSAAAAANNQQQRSQQFATTAATINGHLLSPSVAAQIQNLQLAAAAAANGNGLTAQIQMPNGLTTSGATTLLSQLPGAAQFQQNSQGFNINLNQLSGANIQQIAAAAAAGATFQTPPPPQSHNAANNGQQQTHENSGNNNTTANNTATNDLFSNSSNAMSNITQSSPAHCPVAVTPEPLRQPTPVLQNIPAASPQLTHTPPQIQLSLNAAATIQLQHHQQQQQQAQIQQLQQQIQQTQNQVQQAQQQAQHIHQVHQTQCLPQSQPQPQPVQQEAKKKPKPRKKKPPACNSSANSASASNNKSLTTTANKSLNTNTLTTSVLAPTITSTSNTIKMVPTTSQEQTGQQLISTTTNIPPSNLINQNMQDTTTTANVLKSPSPPPQIQRASNGKLDLGNVMKLCGITDEDDEDFMESTTTEEHTPAQTLAPTQNFTISIPQPNGTSETLPYTLSIPGVQSSSGQSENIESSQEPAANFVIKIDPSETGNGSVNSSVSQPYSITIPRLPSQEEIQKQSQQHLNNLQNENNPSQIKQQQTMLSAQPLNTNITFSLPLTSTAATMPPNNNMPQLISNSLAPSNAMNNNNVMASCAVTTTATTATTATVKPRRKPAAKRNTKKDANNTAASINSSIANSMNITQNVASTSSHIVTPSANITTSAISTPLATPSLVPSQIGNIQISQIDNRISNNSAQLISAPMTSSVENKIQIMPIMDKNTNNAPMPQLQQTQIVFQPNNAANNLSLATTPTAQTTQSLQQDHSRQMQLVALPQLSNSSQASTTSTSNLNTQQQQQSTVTMPSPQINSTLSNHPNNSQNSIMAPVTQTAMLPGLSGNVSISVGTPNTIASIIPQLTGSLTLAVSEQCERLILRHDPNQPQDQQSQLILQALLKGALPNVTIINEPTKVEPPKPATTTSIQQNTIPQPMLTPTGVPNTTISSTAPNSTGAISKSNKKPNKQSTEVAKQQVTQNLSNQMQKTADVNAHSSTTNLNPLNNLNSNMNLSANSQVPPNVTLSQQRYIALPKIDPSTQQLFSLNPLNNQITPINANQTTASIGPTERLLIAPAGINAQQLAQCLQQGQLHFNDVNPLATQQAPVTQQQQQTTNFQMTQQHQQSSMSAMTANTSNLQQPKQQIVYPMTSQGMITTTPTITSTTSNSTTACSTQPATAATTSTTTKQVANVAPIIDQSKAKQDAKQINNSTAANTGAVPKKKPVRKPKASTTTAADVALMKNASVVKPMPKLDPLSQKPNNNPVQIVQPNTASGKPVVSTSTTSTTTTTSNVVTIQPFQTQTSTGTKLVGVTAPMQQQPQNNLQQQQQTQQNRTQTNFNLNFSAASNNNASTNAATNLNTNPPINTLNSGLPLNNNNTVTNGANPPANQPQHTVSRVQTIQLTPQQQQMFKQVQMQIQYLTVKLQHKNLLSSMPLPADLDPNVVAAFNKPMTDMEINTALQRLFMEQHRILAAGKEIPTPEPFITSAANAANSFSLMQSNNFNPDNGKINVGNIPSNVVQPNNHSTLTTNINGSTNVAGSATNSALSNIQQQQLTQKIHIYPIQHQQQNKQSKQPKQQQVILNTNNLNANSGLNNNLITPASVATGINSGNSKVTTKQKPNQAQTQQQIALPQTPSNTGGNNLTTTLVNPPTLNPQLPQLSSLTTTPSLPSLQYPSLPPPHMINIANMPAVLQQKHFTQHLQLQQQQLMQQQQQKLQNSNSNSKPSTNFTTINNLTGFQQGPPPLIFPTSASATTATNNQLSTIAVTSSTATTLTTMPQLSALSQQQQQLTLQSQQPGQIQFQSSNLPATTTFAVSIGNQKAYVPIITGATASLTSSVLQQTSVVSSSTSTSINTVVSSMPQLTPATVALTTTLPSTVASSVAISTPTVMAATGPVKPLLTLAPSSSSNMPLNNSIVVQNAIFNGGINVNIVGNPIAQNQTVVKTEEQISPKAKLARLSLFLRQLEVDQQSCLNPDYKSPFQNKEEAVKRLIRYHCMYQTDEDIPSEEEEEFEKTAIRFQDKFRKLSGKFQQILLQESMLQHRTSEICQMEKLMIEDLQQEIEDSKQLEKDILQYELLQHQQEDQKDVLKDIENPALTNISNPSPCSATEGIFDEIKNEVKSEPLDSKLYIEVNSNNDSNSNFCNNLQSSSSSSSSMDSIKNEIKGEPCDNSLISSSGVKSSCSSMDSFDLLKQSPIVNSSFKKQPVEVKETKKEELSNQWKQSYMDSKNSNTFYHHLPSTAVNISKPSNHVFNGVVKKQQPSQQTTAVNTVANSDMQKDPKESFENFDIESEITPSFIMKKQEPKEPPQTPVTATTATTTTAPIQTTTTTSNTNTATTKSSKSVKQAKISHTFENNLHGPVNNQNASNLQQNQASNSTSAANTEIVTNNFDFSHLPVQNQSTTKQQEDDWLCIQKELNLINSVNTPVSIKNCENSTNNSTPQTATEPLAKALDFLSNATSNDLFPNGCINKNIEAHRQNQSQTNEINTNCGASLVASSCSQQNQQPSLTLSAHEENQQAADLNEFFSGSEDSEVQKDVETRLEAMFGESPVHLSGNKERSDTPEDIESGLESIFGEANKSPSNNHCTAKEKTNWESDFAGNSFMSSAQQHSTNFINTNNSMPHHIQLGSANNPRWMQNMEAQFPDFLTNNTNSSTVNDCMTSRKRQWNGHIVDENADHVQQQTQQPQHVTQDEESPQKKMCDGSMNSGGLNDSSASSSSPLSLQQQQQQQPQNHHHHNLVPNDASHAQELMDAALLSLHDGLGVESPTSENPTQANGFAQMMGHHENFSSYNNHMDTNQQQQTQHFMNINQHQNVSSQQQQMLNNHMMQMNHHQQPSNIHGHHHAGAGEFDDDITRHVQNAIDSILNLQSSEADSLSFSLDHSMGSFLGDTILNDNQSGGNNQASCQDAASKRRHLVDELGDCLMGNSSTGPTSLNETPLLMDSSGPNAHSQLINHSSLHHNSIQQQHHGHVAATSNSINTTTMNNHHSTATGSSNISVSHTQQQQLNDFNCIVGGIDDAVKSIMTS